MLLKILSSSNLYKSHFLQEFLKDKVQICSRVSVFEQEEAQNAHSLTYC